MSGIARARWGIAAAAVCGMVVLGGCATHIAGDPTSGGTDGSPRTAMTGATPGSLAATSPSGTAAPAGQLPTQLPTQSPTEPPTANSRSGSGSTAVPPGKPSGGAGASLLQVVKAAKVVDSKPYQMPGDPTSLGFTSPSGNIVCMVFVTDGGGEEVQCDIADHTYTPPAHDCHGAGVWGQRAQLITGQAPGFACAGDYLGKWPSLAYGNAVAVGPLGCASEKDGVTCVDTVTGNGFRLARASYVFQPEDSSGAPADPSSSLSGFAGQWDQHGGEIVFNSAGDGDYRYRTYVSCDSAPAPCDRIVNNEIISGGHVTVALTSATSGSGAVAATGSVTASNDPRIAQGAPVTATISGSHLEIPAISGGPFCRPDDTSGACGA